MDRCPQCGSFSYSGLICLECQRKRDTIISNIELQTKYARQQARYAEEQADYAREQTDMLRDRQEEEKRFGKKSEKIAGITGVIADEIERAYHSSDNGGKLYFSWLLCRRMDIWNVRDISAPAQQYIRGKRDDLAGAAKMVEENRTAWSGEIEAMVEEAVAGFSRIHKTNDSCRDKVYDFFDTYRKEFPFYGEKSDDWYIYSNRCDVILNVILEHGKIEIPENTEIAETEKYVLDLLLVRNLIRHYTDEKSPVSYIKSVMGLLQKFDSAIDRELKTLEELIPLQDRYWRGIETTGKITGYAAILPFILLPAGFIVSHYWLFWLQFSLLALVSLPVFMFIYSILCSIFAGKWKGKFLSPVPGTKEDCTQALKGWKKIIAVSVLMPLAISAFYVLYLLYAGHVHTASLNGRLYKNKNMKGVRYAIEDVRFESIFPPLKVREYKIVHPRGASEWIENNPNIVVEK